MKKHSLIVILLFFTTIILAQKNDKIDYHNLLITEYQIVGVQNQGHASMLVSKIMSENNNYFCYIDYRNNKCFTLSKKSEDINLNIRGSKFTLQTSKSYSESVFYKLYIDSDKHITQEDNNGDLPNFINTENKFKDDLNYYYIKQIYNKRK